MIPQLVPVRGRNRLGLDRGVVVAAVMAVVIGVLVIRPWSGSDRPVETTVRSPDASAVGVIPSQPTLISLDELRSRSRVEASAEPTSGPGAVFGATIDLIRIPYVGWVPRSTELGSDCVGGAMLGEGNEAIAVRFDEPNVHFFRVERLFDSKPAVRMPVITTETAADGVVLTTALETAWPVGYYAMTVWSRRSEWVLPFCIGRKIRLVDYSMIAYLPADVDDPSARAALVAQIARL